MAKKKRYIVILLTIYYSSKLRVRAQCAPLWTRLPPGEREKDTFLPSHDRVVQSFDFYTYIEI